jgi:hypothetical protein
VLASAGTSNPGICPAPLGIHLSHGREKAATSCTPAPALLCVCACCCCCACSSHTHEDRGAVASGRSKLWMLQEQRERGSLADGRWLWRARLLGLNQEALLTQKPAGGGFPLDFAGSAERGGGARRKWRVQKKWWLV